MNADQIIREVADKNGCTVSFILSRNRRAAPQRCEAMARIRREIGMSYPNIAKVFGVHHTTAYYGVQSILQESVKTKRFETTARTLGRYARVVREQAEYIVWLSAENERLRKAAGQ